MPKPKIQRPWYGLTLSISLLLVSTYIALALPFTDTELRLFRTINNWPDSLQPLFLVCTQFGSVWMVFGAIICSLLLHLNRLALRIFGIVGVVFVVVQFLKFTIARPRPTFFIADASLRENLTLGDGFPSGHTAAATAVGLVLMPLLPRKWRWAVWVWIGLVGLSRIYLGQHAPLDVVGGFAIGLLVVSLSLVVKNKLRFVTKITRLKLSD